MTPRLLCIAVAVMCCGCGKEKADEAWDQPIQELLIVTGDKPVTIGVKRFEPTEIGLWPPISVSRVTLPANVEWRVDSLAAIFLGCEPKTASDSMFWNNYPEKGLPWYQKTEIEAANAVADSVHRRLGRFAETWK